MTAGALRRIGVFGGAFDPPHRAHVDLARAAIAQLQLDELRIVPTGDAWHKPRNLSAAVHRFKMAELAFSDLPQVVVDDRELQRSGPSYTVDTLESLKSDLTGSRFFLLMGGDQFASFKSWHRWEDILHLASICIADRAATGASSGPAAPIGMSNPPFLPSSAATAVLRLELGLMPISATDIRHRVAKGASLEQLAQLVPEPVARYISLHRLYRAA